MKGQARRLIATARLHLLAPDAQLAQAVLDFYTRNRSHFAAWDPPRQADFYSLACHHDRLLAGAESFTSGQGFAYWLQAQRGDAMPIIGQLHFSSVVRGASHNAMLGYALDGAEQGQGLMHEALSAAIDEMFGPPVMLHRLQANVRPENLRSRALLARLGFQHEGLARQYLYIDGAWRHHLMTALINPDFVAPPDL